MTTIILLISYSKDLINVLAVVLEGNNNNCYNLIFYSAPIIHIKYFKNKNVNKKNYFKDLKCMDTTNQTTPH